MEKQNREGLTYAEWLPASGHPHSRKSRKAWRDGEDPTEWMAVRPSSPVPKPKPTSSYEYVGRGRVPDSLKVGDYVHDTSGTWKLWRVVSVFGSDSPFFSAVDVTGSKFHLPCSKRELLHKERHVLEPDPAGFIRHFDLTRYGCLVATREVDDNEIEGRAPIMRTRYLYESLVPDIPGGKRWYSTVDGTSQTWLNKEKAVIWLSSPGVSVVSADLAALLLPPTV